MHVLSEGLVNPHQGLKIRIINALGPLYFYLYVFWVVVRDRRSWRFLPQWFRSFSQVQYLSKEAMPWLPFVATQWLMHYLRPDMKVFEYGSGVSTIFLAQRAGHVLSVEHDRRWHMRVSEVLLRLGLSNCSYQLREPVFDDDKSSLEGLERVLLEDPSEKENPGVSFESYISTIDSHPDQTFDLVLVDGRARPACMEHALPKVKKGGYLVLDNSNDDRLIDCFRIMRLYERKDFHGIAPGWPPGGSTTSIWKIL